MSADAPRDCIHTMPVLGSDPGGGYVYVGQEVGPPYRLDVDEALDFLGDLSGHIVRAVRGDGGFHDLVANVRAILDTTYPADVFDGSSSDPGPVFVAQLREALAGLDADED